jgi:hypothetical protein
MTEQASAPRFSDRDSDILYHVVRYRMTTRDVLHKLFFSDSEPNAVTKVTSRLVKNRFLNRYDLHSGKSYFSLGPNAARIYGFSQKKCKAFGPQALVENYAILQYCIQGTVTRERLLVSELQEQIGSLKGKNFQAAKFYIDEDQVVRKLACMRVEHGGEVAHTVRKCRAELEQLVLHPAIAQLVRHQRFLVAIITSNEAKAAAVKDCIARQTWPVSFRVESVPDLMPLIAAESKTRILDDLESTE